MTPGDDERAGMHIGEATERLLRLQVALIDAAQGELEDMAVPLSKAFCEVAAGLHAAKSRPRAGACSDVPVEAMLAHVSACTRELQRHDRVQQRLQHVVDGFAHIARALSAGPSAHVPEQVWQALCATLRSSYSLEEERRIFDAHEGSADCQSTRAEPPREIELF